MLRKVGDPLIDIHEFYELCVQVGVAECAVCHEGIIEVPRVLGVALEREE